MLPKIMWILLRVLNDCRGATAVEYGLIAALISLACVIAFFSLGLNLVHIFGTIGNALDGTIR
jgi:pilus assembly protein Flp/PilA